MAQELFGLAPSDVVFYNGQETTGALADQQNSLGSRDVKGATVTATGHEEFGNILLDVSNTDKADLMKTAGHEVIETKVL